ncbi:hypothetical protein [Nocardia sp. NPDC019302]|uniref:hypothetical protein n=1 Tax=Nocardia sp. NPDC019302 TaxID=3154592 RepID=UPI0033F5CFFD
MNARTTLRRARKVHFGCHPIKPGEHYLEFTDFPGSDLGFADAAGHPVRLAECRACAERYGRGHLFPTSSPQPDPLRSEAAPSASRDVNPGAEGASHVP